MSNILVKDSSVKRGEEGMAERGAAIRGVATVVLMAETLLGIGPSIGLAQEQDIIEAGNGSFNVPARPAMELMRKVMAHRRMR